MPDQLVASPRYSFKGYDFMRWVGLNAGWIKGTLAGVTTVLGLQQWWVALAGVMFIVAKFGYDALDYFLSAQPV